MLEQGPIRRDTRPHWWFNQGRRLVFCLRSTVRLIIAAQDAELTWQPFHFITIPVCSAFVLSSAFEPTRLIPIGDLLHFPLHLLEWMCFSLVTVFCSSLYCLEMGLVNILHSNYICARNWQTEVVAICGCPHWIQLMGVGGTGTDSAENICLAEGSGFRERNWPEDVGVPELHKAKGWKHPPSASISRVK